MESLMTTKEIVNKAENLKLRFAKMKKEDKLRGDNDNDIFLKFEACTKLNNNERKMAEYYRLLRKEAKVKKEKRNLYQKQCFNMLKSFKLTREQDKPISRDNLLKFVNLESDIDQLHKEAYVLIKISEYTSYIFMNSRLKDSAALQKEINESYKVLGELEAISPDKPLSWRHQKILGGIFNKKCEEITSIWQKHSEEGEGE